MSTKYLASLAVALFLAHSAGAVSIHDPKVAYEDIEDLRSSQLSQDEFAQQAVELRVRLDELEAEHPDRLYNIQPKPGIATLVVEICKTCRPQRLNLILNRVKVLTGVAVSMADTKLSPTQVYTFRPGYMGDKVQSHSASNDAGKPVFLHFATQVNAGEYMFAAPRAAELGQPKLGSGIFVDREKIAQIYHLIKKYHDSAVIKVI